TNPSVATLNASPASQADQLAGSEIASVIPHPWKNDQLAVTLRINQIPVVTFVGTPAELATLANNQSLTADGNTLQRAEAIAAQLNQLAQDSDFDASTIQLEFDQTAKQYVIKTGETTLITLDKNTVLPEKALAKHQSALQITNRLRRLLGGAEPLATAPAAPPMVNVSNSLAYNSINRIRGGMASWYGPGFHGRRTANGERFNQYAMTAAHKSLPFGTKVKVTNLRNGKSVVVRINDRGPFIRGRVIDLSKGAAQAIGVHSSGVANVALDVIR
ncbi:MAG: rare lipoprotein, partial [Cyanobacteriota bacterium]